MSEQTTAMVQRGLGGMRRVRPLEKQILDEARRAIAQRQATILAQRCARQRRNALLAAISVAVVVLAPQHLGAIAPGIRRGHEVGLMALGGAWQSPGQGLEFGAIRARGEASARRGAKGKVRRKIMG